MDTLTQINLGAAVAVLALGKKVVEKYHNIGYTKLSQHRLQFSNGVLSQHWLQFLV